MKEILISVTGLNFEGKRGKEREDSWPVLSMNSVNVVELDQFRIILYIANLGYKVEPNSSEEVKQISKLRYSMANTQRGRCSVFKPCIITHNVRVLNGVGGCQ